MLFLNDYIIQVEEGWLQNEYIIEKILCTYFMIINGKYSKIIFYKYLFMSIRKYFRQNMSNVIFCKCFGNILR